MPLSTLVADVLGVILLAAFCALCLSARAPSVSEIQLSVFFEPYPLLPKQHPDWQWEVGRCSPMNVGKTVDRIPTIKYRFNYTHCVHL